MNREDLFIERLTARVGSEDYNRDSIKGRYSKFKHYIKNRFSFDCPIVIVGGTNGKGEVCQGIAELAGNKDKKVAVWTSPHIESLVERYSYNGGNIEWEDLVNIIEKELQETKDKPHFSMFEVLFVAFIEWIKDMELDLIIFEVGLGGRFDAVNVFDADISIITSISRDHTAYLGNSYRSILDEKFEITRAKSFFIGQSPLSYVRTMMKEKAITQNMEHEVFGQQSNETYSSSNKKIIKLALKKLYPEENFTQEISPRIKNWRDQVFFNGAHNIDGMRQLMASLSPAKIAISRPKVIIAFSNRPLKDVTALLKVLKRSECLFSEQIMTNFEHTRSLNATQSRQAALDNGMLFSNDWKKYIDETIESNKKLFVIGSYYFVGEVKHYLASYSSHSSNE